MIALLFSVLVDVCTAQLTPALVGQDAETPGFTFCNHPDVPIIPFPFRITDCNLDRSDTCDMTTFRCVMSAAISNPNISAPLLNFDITTYAELMPGTNDGKALISLSYVMPSFFSLVGFVQLWIKDPATTNTYIYAKRVYEITFFSGASFLFHGLAGGTYVATYWDDGGTRLGSGIPEISQPFVILDIFPAMITTALTISAIPINAYDTNYQRSNRNFISYQLNGPLGFRSVLLNACTDPRYNRCVFWEERTDQGNIKNAKTYLDPNYPLGLDTMLQFKIFPIMCCTRYTRITARLVYGGASPLFPTQYEDYWDQRQNYGYGTDIASKILRLGRTYYDQTFGCGGGADCSYQTAYQRLVSANWNTPLNTSYPACTATSAQLNTLTSLDSGTDLFTTVTLRRNYCECFTGTACADLTVDPHAARAFRSGLQSYSNNYDKYEDWYSISDEPFGAPNFDQNFFYWGDFGGRPFSFDFDFAAHTNNGNDAIDYSCRPTGTHYANLNFINVNGLEGGSFTTVNTNGLLTDVSIDKFEMNDFYNYQGAYPIDSCNTKNVGSAAACNAGESTTNANYFGGFNSPCNCLSLIGFFGSETICVTFSPPMSAFIDACWPIPVGGTNSDFTHNYRAQSIEMCCNKPAQDNTWSYHMSFSFEVSAFGAGTANPMCSYIAHEWRGNKRAEFYQTDYPTGLPYTNPVQVNIFNNEVELYQANFNNDYCHLQGLPFCLLTYGPGTDRIHASYLNFAFLQNSDPRNPITSLVNAQSGPNSPCSATPGAGNAIEFQYTASFSDSTFIPVFGTIGLDTFPVTFWFRKSFTKAPNTDKQYYRIQSTFPTYARFKVLPTIEFYQFSNVDSGSGISPQPTIWITFRISCPNVDMDPSNNGVPGKIGFCAQTWFITNQVPANIYVGTIYGPTLVTESQTGLPAPFNSMQSLGDVYGSAIFTVKILYNDGDVLSWHFFPKTEAEQPANLAFCTDGSSVAFDGYFVSPFTVTVPMQYHAMLPMIASIRSVPPACEYNQPEMLLSTFRGEGFVYEVALEQNLGETVYASSPLDYPQYVNYWIHWQFLDGTHLDGFSVYFLPYQAGAVATVYDQENFIGGLTPAAPITIPIYPNPLVRQTSCTDTTATCLMPNDDTENPAFSRIVPYHYCFAGQNALILKPVLVFAGNFTFVDQVGALYCNMTTANIDVFIQEQQTQALFGINFECNVTQTGYYTYTVRYGKSVQAFVSPNTFPCYERLITYAIILTNFQPEPQQLIRIPLCARADNCCYQLLFNVMGNTGDTEDIVNMNTCNTTSNMECLYEIVTSPPPMLPEMGLCPGETYTFTFQSPAALVSARVGPTISNFFQYPWRCPGVATVTLPTEGFSAIGVSITNGNCGVQGSFLEITFTYTNPLCVGPIIATAGQPNPICKFNLYFLMVAAGGGGVSPPAGPGPSGSYKLIFPNTVSFNIPFTFDFPQILGNPAYVSVPDGFYNLYLWVAPAATPLMTFSQAITADPRNGVTTRITPHFDVANGMRIIINSINYPQCPSTNATGDPRTNAIAVVFTVIDQNWNGPYNLTFQLPTGQYISNYTVDIHDPAACGETCSTLLTNITSCSVCDIKIRNDGIQHTFYVGTGVSSPNEQDFYPITANAIGTDCVATALPFIVPMNPYSVQIRCRPSTCSNVQDGVVYSYARGGRLIPIPQGDLVQNSDLTLAEERYQYFWNFTTLGPNGTNVTTHYVGVDTIPAAAHGFYELTIIDDGGCIAYDSCVESSVAPQIQLELISSMSLNCSNEQGAITVAVANNTGTPPFTLYKVGPNQHPVSTSNGFILTDQTVRPGQEFFYMVCDANECCSPMLNLSIHAPAGFNVRLSVPRIPCSTSSTSGMLSAIIVDDNGNNYAGNQPSFKWYRNGAEQVGVTSQTIGNVGVGVWRVDATNINGCTSSATVAVYAATNLGFTASRTGPNVDSGIIQGSIVGGNGPPYTLTVQPSSNPPSPPDIGNIVIVNVIQANEQENMPITTYRISMVPPQANIFITITDGAGCVFRNESRGQKIPITSPLITPSQTPEPHNFKHPKEEEDFSGLIAMVFGTVTFIITIGMCCGILVPYFRERERKRQASKLL